MDVRVGLKKAECQRVDAFEMWCWRRLLRIPWTARRSNQSILKEINSDYSWKDWCWSWNSNTLATWWEELTHWKRPWCCERLRVGGEGDDRGWNGWMASTQCLLNGNGFGQAWGIGEGQGSLVCYSPWGHKESDTTERLNSNNNLIDLYWDIKVSSSWHTAEDLRYYIIVMITVMPKSCQDCCDWHRQKWLRKRKKEFIPSIGHECVWNIMLFKDFFPLLFTHYSHS